MNGSISPGNRDWWCHPEGERRHRAEVGMAEDFDDRLGRHEDMIEAREVQP
jgi:hypothetical protein